MSDEASVMQSEPVTGQVNYGELIKRVEELVEDIDQVDDPVATVNAIAAAVIARFGQELGVSGGRLYRRDGNNYALLGALGEAREVPSGLEIPNTYAPIEVLLDRRTLFMTSDDPRLDRALEAILGAKTFAAIELDRGRFILAFDLLPGFDAEGVLYSLGILRFAITQKLRTERLVDVFRQAQRIQESIFPRRDPRFGPFDICGRSEPMKRVGGDYYDFMPVTEKLLGLAVADVSGHGLPAALQVRDIYTGLRMGLSRDLKITRTMERLNSIIHRSTLTSRFVSLFYGELELGGTFVYVNAGHNPPFHLKADGSSSPLSVGGTVLGPVESATYERGFISLQRGDVLVLYTDGVVETRGESASGEIEEFGTERLLDLVRARLDRTAAEIVADIFAELRAFEKGRPPQDDRTLTIVRFPKG